MSMVAHCMSSSAAAFRQTQPPKPPEPLCPHWRTEPAAITAWREFCPTPSYLCDALPVQGCCVAHCVQADRQGGAAEPREDGLSCDLWQQQQSLNAAQERQSGGGSTPCIGCSVFWLAPGASRQTGARSCCPGRVCIKFPTRIPCSVTVTVEVHLCVVCWVQQHPHCAHHHLVLNGSTETLKLIVLEVGRNKLRD